MKSKCGVSPLITHPKAINPLYLFIFLEIVIGISKTPGTLIILKLVFLLRYFFDMASIG